MVGVTAIFYVAEFESMGSEPKIDIIPRKWLMRTNRDTYKLVANSLQSQY